MSSEPFIPVRVRVLRRLNPLIARILRSFAHGVLSRRLLLLQYRGRKTDRIYSIPLAYALHDGRPYCVTRQHTAWWKSVAASASVTIWVQGVKREATPERVSGDSEEARVAFARFLASFPSTASLLYHVQVNARGEPNADALRREIHNSVVVRLTPQ